MANKTFVTTALTSKKESGVVTYEDVLGLALFPRNQKEKSLQTCYIVILFSYIIMLNILQLCSNCFTVTYY